MFFFLNVHIFYAIKIILLLPSVGLHFFLLLESFNYTILVKISKNPKEYLSKNLYLHLKQTAKRTTNYYSFLIANIAQLSYFAAVLNK